MTAKVDLSAETKYGLLLEIEHKVRGTLDLDSIMNHLLDTIGSVMDYDAAGIFILNRGAVLPHRGPPGNVIAGIALRGFDLGPPEADPMLSEGKGVIGRVIRTGETVLISDVAKDPDYIAGRKRNLQFEIGTDMNRALIEVMNRLNQVPRYPVDADEPIISLGGDSFDYIDLPGGRLGLAVADVSGKGVPAALIMSAFRALMRDRASECSDIRDMAGRLNKFLLDDSNTATFVTAVYGTLDPPSGEFRYSVLGHNPPLLLRADGRCEELRAGGLPLGIRPRVSPLMGEARLRRGDVLVLYTDGVVESGGPEGPDFGLERLVDVLRHSLQQNAMGMIKNVVQATTDFSGSPAYRDDFTLVVVKRTP
ncbi:MAG: SpoIIE family protein phosphatase [Acidobacteriota bacterium]